MKTRCTVIKRKSSGSRIQLCPFTLSVFRKADGFSDSSCQQTEVPSSLGVPGMEEDYWPRGALATSALAAVPAGKLSHLPARA